MVAGYEQVYSMIFDWSEKMTMKKGRLLFFFLFAMVGMKPMCARWA